MSHHLGRVVSDLSHSNSRGATRHGLRHHQSTATTSNTNVGGGNKAKQKLALLFSSVVAWARKESSAAAETGTSSSSSRPPKSRRKQETTNNNGGGGARRPGRLDIVLAVRKYLSMVEKLIFASYSGGGGGSRDGDGRRRRPHTFTYGRAGGASSKRHKGRLSSAPASLRGSPASSGHLAVGESVVMARQEESTSSSEVSTMEELHSAIQAAIAHCKSSAADAAGGGGGRQ
ncbi:unnamed protein product [Urochloa humidicola]